MGAIATTLGPGWLDAMQGLWRGDGRQALCTASAPELPAALGALRQPRVWRYIATACRWWTDWPQPSEHIEHQDAIAIYGNLFPSVATPAQIGRAGAV